VSRRWRRAWLGTIVRRMHQSLHHLVADAPWNDQELLVGRRDFTPESLMLCFARLMRCAMVASVTRNALALCPWSVCQRPAG